VSGAAAVVVDAEGGRRGVVQIARAGLDWRVDAEFRDVVVETVIDRLASLAESGASVVKHNRMRTVYRIPVSGASGSLYLKVHRVPTAFERMKSLVRPSRAVTEWRMMTLFREAGLPTARPLAVAERRVRGVLRDAYFLTEGIEDARDLVPWLLRAFPGRPRGRARAAKREILSELARLVRAMHDRGVWYADLHSGNVLVTGERPEDARIHFIDLHTGRRARRLGVRARLRNLARLGHSLLEATSRTDRLRLFLAYAGDDGVLGSALRRTFRRSEARIAKLERRRLRSRDLRCVVESSRFTKLRSQGIRGFAQRRFPSEFWLDVVAGHARAVRGESGTVFKNGRSTRVTAFAVGGERVCVKEYRCPSPLDRLKRALGYRKSVRAWRAGNALAVRGVEAAEPLACLIGAGPHGADLLVMRDVSELARLDHFVFEKLGGAESPARRRLARAVARWVAGLHRSGVYHNDLKACNVLVAGSDDARRFVLIDYDGARALRRPVSAARRVKNLAQLSASIPTFVSLAERFRFFDVYADGRMVRAERRRYQRGVVDACRRKILVRDRTIE
jgi:tRNA A-37 threonylcarbamoyl transferase component Bud32